MLARTLVHPRIRSPQPFQHVLLHRDHFSAHRLTPVKRAQFYLRVAVEKERYRIAVPAASVDHPMRGALVDAFGPHREHVADIDNVGVWVRRHGMPGAGALLEDFKTARGILKEEGNCS